MFKPIAHAQPAPMPERITATLVVVRVVSDSTSKAHQYKLTLSHRSHSDKARLKTLLDEYAAAHFATVHDENGDYVVIIESKSLDALLERMRLNALRMQIDLKIARGMLRTDVSLETRSIVAQPNGDNAYNISVGHKHLSPDEKALLLNELIHYAKQRKGAELIDDGSKFSFNTEILSPNIYAQLLRGIKEDLGKFFTVEILREKTGLPRSASLLQLQAAAQARRDSDPNGVLERRRSSVTSPTPPEQQAPTRARSVSPRVNDLEFPAPPTMLFRSTSAVEPGAAAAAGGNIERTTTNPSSFARPNRAHNLPGQTG